MPHGVVKSVAFASAASLAATKVFVPSMQALSVGGPSGQSALRGTSASTSAEIGLMEGSSATSAALMGLAGSMAIMSISRISSKGRTALRAEPVSAAAVAAAAAAKAVAAGTATAKTVAAVKGATNTVGAVAGSAATGSLGKAASANVDDDSELAMKKLSTLDRGSPEYEAIKAAKERMKEREWEVRTGRNPDGVFGDAGNARKGKGGNLYDPLDSLSSNWLSESGNEFNPAFQIGATEPLGFFDPLGFCKKGDEEGFRKLRSAEIKHGRVAMMAALGAVVQHFVKFPGFQDVPSGLAAVNTPPGSYGFIALFLVAGVLELAVWTEKPGTAPGNFGDPLGLNQYNEDTRNRELNNGRLGMFAAFGIIVAELLTGKDGVEQLGF